MILKSITITGFKSFAKKTVIDLTHNVTGVVGPNGSGKSNIGEAVRFVMGEQSMKSIRSKSLGDLVFKGGEGAGSMSRALVSMELDNSGQNKKYAQSNDDGMSKFLAYDDIVLSREVFVDGASVYKINNSEVRLKDVQSLLAFAGIGASTHTIISQGEADKILVASKKERKEMIEDALGLKIHHIRLKDSERKLKKVEENMRVANIMRREISPELRHLESQMNKINKVEEEREKLLLAYIKYFAFENSAIENLKNKLNQNINFEENIKNLLNKINGLTQKENEMSKTEASKVFENDIRNRKNILENERQNVQSEISIKLYEKNNILNKINSEIKIIEIKKEVFVNFKSDIKFALNNVSKALTNNNNFEAENYLKEAQSLIMQTDNWHTESLNKDNLNESIKVIDEEVAEKQNILNEIKERINKVEAELIEHNNNILFGVRKIYEEKYILENELNKINNEKQRFENDVAYYKIKDTEFTEKLNEAHKFVGPSVLNYKNEIMGEEFDKNYKHYDNERLIERLKIRIEELGILDPTSIRNNFEELKGRDEHLGREIEDLNKTKLSLDTLILELESSIKNDFTKGLEKINFAFNNYFHEVFSGGKASLIITKNVESDEGEDGDNNFEEVEGVDISINLPSKKVNDINMLSGGERTLSSIALLFAMTSIIPPPFMVLDETDAALDELNARKYGKMLGRLSEKSRLLVITHNRETMNECDVLYGVTMGQEGFSCLLSIKFDK